MDELTTGEREYLRDLSVRLRKLTEFLNGSAIYSENTPVPRWYEMLVSMKTIEGNMDNTVSFVACLLARDYLVSKVDVLPFDVSSKHQNASGYDITAKTSTGQIVVGEVKTTLPQGATDLGSNQRTNFRKDFAKLNNADAHLKFFFVTEERTFELMKSKYADEIPGVTVVLLPEGKSTKR